MKSVILTLALMACGEKEKVEGMTVGDCTDGADNDGDGDFDCNDDGCLGSPDCSGTNDTGAEDTGISDGLSVDDDGDGVSENEGDCDDSDASIYPGAPEDFNDGLDNDCDGFADMSNVQCSADMTIEFADSETVTLDFCQRWSLESTFEYDPNNPPELNSISLNMNATTATDFDCSIQIEQEGICGEGYYRQGLSTGSTVMATMDCSGVSDDNKQTLNFSEGYLRIDSIDTGNQSGSFAGQSLSAGLVGHLHVWNTSGDALDGDISISVEQLASDPEENVCTLLDISTTDEDGDGHIADYFGGDDCGDLDANSTTIYTDADCDGVLTADDCDDSDASLLSQAIDSDCDGIFNLDLGDGFSMDFVSIPAGSDPQGRYNITNGFYLMTTEVTQGMFTALMPYDSTTYSTTYGVGNDYPIYYVNWHMAADFANKVTQRHNSMEGTSLQQCYSCSNSGSISVTCTEAVNPYQCSGYVLPTEAEWEYAARSGTQHKFWTPDGGGNYSAEACNGTETIQDGVSNPLLRDYAWYCGNRNNAYGVEGSKEVGQKLPNGFGLYDMHGNIWEWTADLSGCSFPQTSTEDPYCESAGSYRVRRGGDWSNQLDYLQASSRLVNIPTDRYRDIGFRLGLHP